MKRKVVASDSAKGKVTGSIPAKGKLTASDPAKGKVAGSLSVKGKGGFWLKIENVVSFTSLGKKIPLIKIANKLHEAEYSPESFPGVVYRIKDPRAATLIFSSGKIVCTGAKGIALSKEAMRRVVDDIRKVGIPLPKKFHIKIENIVASTRIAVKGKLNLEEISFSLDNVEYEPEQFPGLVCRIPEPRVAFLVFGSGKIICTGGRTVDNIHEALGKLKQRLEKIGIKVRPMQN